MQNEAVNVLDHGFVRLVDSMGDDIDIVRAARTSYDAAWRSGEDKGSDYRLINYLWSHRHTTPFEMVELKFEIKAPIFVMRQWQRHRTWDFTSVNELSARYRELPEEFYVPNPAMVGVQSRISKQARDISGKADQQRSIEVVAYQNACKEAFALYQSLLGNGWPRELARTVLPLGTYTHLFAKTNLLNLLHFMSLRSDPHAQYEIRVYADAMRDLIRPIVPVALAAWEAQQKTAEANPGGI